MTHTVCPLDEYFCQIPIADNVNKEDVARLRDWIETQLHLPVISDRQISKFLHSCYSDFELTKNTIEQYYSQRTLYNDIFSNRKIEKLKAYLRVFYVYKSPHLSVDGLQILHIGLLDKDSGKFDPLLNIKVMFALLDLLTNLEPYAPGWRLCADVKCAGFGHHLKLTANVNLSRKLIIYLTSALPIRLKGIHVRNVNSLMSQFIFMLKPFLKKEVFEMIHLHSSSDEKLYDYIPRDAIPAQDYENLLASSGKLINGALALLDEYENWFVDDERLARTDETKRVKSTTESRRGTSFFRSLMGGKSE